VGSGGGDEQMVGERLVGFSAFWTTVEASPMALLGHDGVLRVFEADGPSSSMRRTTWHDWFLRGLDVAQPHGTEHRDLVAQVFRRRASRSRRRSCRAAVRWPTSSPRPDRRVDLAAARAANRRAGGLQILEAEHLLADGGAELGIAFLEPASRPFDIFLVDAVEGAWPPRGYRRYGGRWPAPSCRNALPRLRTILAHEIERSALDRAEALDHVLAQVGRSMEKRSSAAFGPSRYDRRTRSSAAAHAWMRLKICRPSISLCP